MVIQVIFTCSCSVSDSEIFSILQIYSVTQVVIEHVNSLNMFQVGGSPRVSVRQVLDRVGHTPDAAGGG